MNKIEARELLQSKVTRLRALRYSDLLALLESPQVEQIVGPSGAVYQLEIEAVWDRSPGDNLRVLASIDDEGWRAWSPLAEGFILAPDGSFVDEDST
jgi:hypothetical protein